MFRRTSVLSILMLVCCLGQAVVCAAAEGPKTGEKRDTLLYVRTTPPGAKVLLDGKELGTSDDMFSVGPGVGRIVIELDGYQAEPREVTIKANAVTRIELTLKQQAGTEPMPATKAATPATAAEDGRLVGHLRQGTVELVGITDYPLTVQSRWWRPDGSAAQLGPYSTQPKDWPLPAETALEFLLHSQHARAFLLRFQNTPADLSHPACDVEKHCTGTWWGRTGVWDAQEKIVRNCKLFCAQFDAATESANLRVKTDVGTVEFKNVSLRSGQKTAAEVVSPHTTPPATSAKPVTDDGAATRLADPIVEGVGWRAIRVGAKREDIISALGKPDADSSSDWLKWAKQHIDCTFYSGEVSVCEVRFNPGFEGALANGITIGSPANTMLNLYGEPEHTLDRGNGAKLYEYSKKGVLFWTKQGKIIQITVLKPQDAVAQPAGPAGECEAD